MANSEQNDAYLPQREQFALRFNDDGTVTVTLNLTMTRDDAHFMVSALTDCKFYDL